MKRSQKDKRIDLLEQNLASAEAAIYEQRKLLGRRLAAIQQTQRELNVVRGEREDARLQRDVLAARIDSATKALKEPLATGGAVKRRAPGGWRLEESHTLRTGQVRRNRDYPGTLIRILAPPLRCSYGTDDTWLVEYLTTGRTIRRSTQFIRTFYPLEKSWVPLQWFAIERVVGA